MVTNEIVRENAAFDIWEHLAEDARSGNSNAKTNRWIREKRQTVNTDTRNQVRKMFWNCLDSYIEFEWILSTKVKVKKKKKREVKEWEDHGRSKENSKVLEWRMWRVKLDIWWNAISSRKERNWQQKKKKKKEKVSSEGKSVERRGARMVERCGPFEREKRAKRRPNEQFKSCRPKSKWHRTKDKAESKRKNGKLNSDEPKERKGVRTWFDKRRTNQLKGKKRLNWNWWWPKVIEQTAK